MSVNNYLVEKISKIIFYYIFFAGGIILILTCIIEKKFSFLCFLDNDFFSFMQIIMLITIYNIFIRISIEFNNKTFRFKKGFSKYSKWYSFQEISKINEHQSRIDLTLNDGNILLIYKIFIDSKKLKQFKKIKKYVSVIKTNDSK